FFFFSSRRLHTRCYRDWSSDVCSSDLGSQGFRISAPCGIPGIRSAFPVAPAADPARRSPRKWFLWRWEATPVDRSASRLLIAGRSEERRVGEGCRAGGGG